MSVDAVNQRGRWPCPPLLLRPAGLVVALVVLVLISGMGSHDRNFKQLLVLTAGLVIMVLTVFIYGLGLTLPVWPAFMRD